MGLRAGRGGPGWEPLLDELVRMRYSRLVAHASLLVGSVDEAQDLVQDALVSTFSGRARFASLPEAEAYVRRAVVSRFVDQGRRRTSERRALAREAVLADRGAVGGGVEVGGGLLGPEVERALLGLSPRTRACVVLRHMEDLSVRETAALLRLSEGAVKRYVSDGVAALNAALGTASSDQEPVQVTEEVRRDA